MKAAKRPERRTVTVELDGDFSGWRCVASADFRAGLLVKLQAGTIEGIVEALDEIVLEHNFPDADGNLAEHMADVDPYDGLIQAGVAIFSAIGKLPNR